MRKHTPLVVGNWKMNPNSAASAQNLFKETIKYIGKKQVGIDVGLCVPFIYMEGLSKIAKKSVIALGSQDIAIAKEGAHTGEVSGTMLKDQSVKQVIVGHSERRVGGESDEQVMQKVQSALSQGFTTIVCVGERARDAHGNYFGEVEAQLHSILVSLVKKSLPRLVIAYEPVWAIGSGRIPTAAEVQEMKLFIQKVIASHMGRESITKVRIIYGGSVNSANAKELLSEGEVDGFLIGGASLKPREFSSIVSICSKK